MNIHNASFVLSAVARTQYPNSTMPEIAFAGRSNVGKSSFINKMLNRKNLARISGRPGKTAQLNYYNIDNELHMVDLPGYGYAEVSKVEKAKWGLMIEEYLYNREPLVQTVIILDSRHKPTLDDLHMCNWIRRRHGRLFAVATKIDKLTKSKIPEHLEVIKNEVRLTSNDILMPFSAETGEGRDELWHIICELCKINELKGMQ